MKTIRDVQKEIDAWIVPLGGYFGELTQMAQLTEEVGEVARIMSRTYGEQSFKQTDTDRDLGDELADVMFTVACIANSTGIDLQEALEKNLSKKMTRDVERHLGNTKLNHKK